MIRIVIAEDQELLLDVIGSLLNLEEDIEVVGQAKNGLEALSLVYRLQPDICIMDIDMPVMNGLDAADALRATGCRVIMMTTFARAGYVERARKAGVRGYLLKDSPSHEFICSIRCIMNGKRIFSPELIEQASKVCRQRETGIEEFDNQSNADFPSRRSHHMFKWIRSHFLSIIVK
ncbi:response regulator [Bacillus tuaregi]|uniref:response regulator n=1 Tax=Bacillus tuaregi TaxID=1816695 RepID=UPI0008F80389|nr:response regulator transcription factor [Bacillus tuaregi]